MSDRRSIWGRDKVIARGVAVRNLLRVLQLTTLPSRPTWSKNRESSPVVSRAVS
jgi:hypothetical protein